MPITRSFKELVKNRADADPSFRAALLAEAVETLVGGDPDTARLLLRDFVNATLGFERLSAETGLGTKSLMRMLGPSGNPTIGNLAKILVALRRDQRLDIVVETKPAVDPDREAVETPEDDVERVA